MIGRTLKQYRVEATLGRGGMGEVYLARDTRLDRPIALKVLPADLTLDPDRRRRFLLEARAACAVNHPAIAQIYDADEHEGVTFIAMELVEGRTVRHLVEAGELDLLGAVEIALQVAQGLAKAHDSGIVHRDIKSDNIMVTADGHAKILDFGLAKLRETGSNGSPNPGDGAASMALTRTQAGVVLGTVGYMSPEQARGRPVDHRSDLFSLGIVLYEMATGQSPFPGTSPLDTLHAIAYEEAPPITQVRAGLPGSLDRVIGRCLRKSPEERYPDARALVADLKRVEREIETGISRPVPLVERIRDGVRSLRRLGPGRWLVAGGLATALATLAFLWLTGDKGATPGIVFTAVIGLLVYRRLRNRGHRLIRRFVKKVRKMPEVRVIALVDRRATVLVDRALARTYVRINALIDETNRRLFFGEPFSVAVRDDPSKEETHTLLRGPGVLYVRADVLGEKNTES